ncbi:MAG TPA: nuclear transport factor 2 family protein [Galbitalea sp.]|nr:nuclear transport factor 2 family protein [Galbitalea sp.]
MSDRLTDSPRDTPSGATPDNQAGGTSDPQTDALSTWMTAYRRAWESNDPADIGALFTDDAVYYKEPFTEPLRGRDAIIAMWHENQDAPGTPKFTWKPLSVMDGLAFVQGETDYATVRYSNLWVIRLAVDGGGVVRATEFTEWWMDQSKPS